MNEPIYHDEGQSLPTLSSQEKDSIHLRAELRRSSIQLGTNLNAIMERISPDVGEENHQQDFDRVMSIMATNLLPQEIPKVQQLLDVQESFLPDTKTKPYDFINDALRISLYRTFTADEPLPLVAQVAAAVAAGDRDLLADYALVLPESEREKFLQHIAEPMRAVIAARMDYALSHTIDPVEPQYQAVSSRTQEQLKVALADAISKQQPTMEKALVKTLAQTLAQLGDRDATKVLTDAARSNLSQVDTSNQAPAYAARLIRELMTIDEYTGTSLAVQLMGQQKINPRYMRYFWQYLQENNLLTGHIDTAGKYWSEEQCQQLYRFLQEPQESVWKDELNVSIPFARGQAIFGIKKMIWYAGRPDVGPHDALLAFDQIIILSKASGLKPQDFYSKILEQVWRDSQVYERGNSYLELNRIAQSLDLSDEAITKLKKTLDKYTAINELAGLRDYLDTPQQIFASWNNLKHYSNFVELLGRSEILDKLVVLQKEAQSDPAKQRLYDFIQTLALRKGSKVDMQAVLQLWQDPEGFFRRGDVQIDNNAHLQEVHEAISPLNWEDIPFLDVTIEDIRNALVDGTYDRIALFPPMEIVYSVSEKESHIRQEMSFHEQVRRQIGSKKERTLNSPLFKQLKPFFTAQNINIIDYLKGDNTIIDDLSDAVKESLRDQIQQAISQFPNPQLPKDTGNQIPSRAFRARVHPKSSIAAIVAGNDVPSCKYFGAGKNNDYWTNPAVGAFTLEEERNGRWRTIVDIILTPDMLLDTTVPELIKNYDMNRIMGNLTDAALSGDRHVAYDNIERSANDQSGEQFVKAMLQEFFTQYIPHLNAHVAGIGIQFDATHVVVGQGNSDIRYGDQAANKYLPTAVIGYSDNLGGMVDMIRLDGQADTKGKTITIESIDVEQSATDKEPVTGLLPLTPIDTMGAAYLETKAYPPAMREGITAIQNYLCASMVANEIKDRPHLSLKYVDSQGVMRGYLLAWEGVRDNAPVVYIEDIAADWQSTLLAGGKLMKGFMDVYKREYLDRGIMMPLYMNAREETSYPILKKHFAKLSSKLGIDFEMQEISQHKHGDSFMHNVLITPKRKDDNRN